MVFSKSTLVQFTILQLITRLILQLILWYCIIFLNGSYRYEKYNSRELSINLEF